MKRGSIILIHVLFWFYLVNQSLFPLYTGEIVQAKVHWLYYMKEVVASTAFNIIAFYTVYFAFPRLFRIKNLLMLSGIALLIIMALTFFRSASNWYLWHYTAYFPAQQGGYHINWVWNDLRLTIITGIYAILIRFLIRAFEMQKQKNELVSQQQASELALIKAKVNPHFLFNTLNSIYSLVYKKSDDAPGAVMKLSSIMRYVLTEADKDFILLDNEIEYLRDYIELQKLRMNNPGFVEVHFRGNTENVWIAPMLLIPFVENAFKHGSKQQSPGIIISLDVEGPDIHFEVTNHIRERHISQQKSPGTSGFSNIRRRLELIYPDKHNISVSQGNGLYKVTLIISR